MTDVLPWLLGALAMLFGGLLYFVFDGYLRLLRIASRFAPRRNGVEPKVPADPPSLGICVLITVHRPTNC